VEADLSRYHQLDLRDLWRGRLTLRQVFVRVRHLPPDSAVSTATGSEGWTLTDYLLADVFTATTGGQTHPADPRARVKRKQVAGLRRQKQRAAQRRQRLGITGSVLRKP
jgi:hypothetical protein